MPTLVTFPSTKILEIYFRNGNPETVEFPKIKIFDGKFRNSPDETKWNGNFRTFGYSLLARLSSFPDYAIPFVRGNFQEIQNRIFR